MTHTAAPSSLSTRLQQRHDVEVLGPLLLLVARPRSLLALVPRLPVQLSQLRHDGQVVKRRRRFRRVLRSRSDESELDELDQSPQAGNKNTHGRRIFRERSNQFGIVWAIEIFARQKREDPHVALVVGRDPTLGTQPQHVPQDQIHRFRSRRQKDVVQGCAPPESLTRLRVSMRIG